MDHGKEDYKLKYEESLVEIAQLKEQKQRLQRMINN